MTLATAGAGPAIVMLLVAAVCGIVIKLCATDPVAGCM